jgi:subtilase family serine protease
MRTPRPGWLARGLVAGGAALALTAGMAAPAALADPAGPNGRQVLPAYVPMWSRTSGGSATADLGPAAANAPVQARVYLAGRDPRGLTAYGTAVSTPGDALFHHYLTPEQVQRRFGPTARQVAAVEAWLRGSGLRVTGATSHYVTVAGTAAEAQAAFGAVWHSYTVAGEVQQSPPPEATLSAPDAVAGALLTVVPTEIGPPGPRQPGPARPSTLAQPCSDYFGQRPATDLPQAYGRTAPYGVCAYTPQQLRSAYGVPATLTGKGVTAAVIHPSHEGTAASDLATFGARNGEPLRPGQFTELLPPDLDASCPGGAIRAGKTSINPEEVPDVESVHAMAPDANIDYLGTECDDDLGTLSGLDALTEIVDQRLASIVSNSWGPTSLSPGVMAAFDNVLEQGAAEGIGFYFGSGIAHSGETVSGFSADPWVTAVGGSTLAVGPQGNYEWETGWGDHAAPLASDGTNWTSLPGSFARGGGGGTSSLFTQPAYQRGVVPASLSHAGGASRPMRVIPDISADSDPATPILSGGTDPGATGKPTSYTDFPSAGANTIALVAGLQADAQQAAGTPIGFANPAIYARAGTPAYHDVTDQPLGPGVRLDAAVPAGVDAFGAPSTPELITFGLDEGRSATPGYDAVTGVGTPTADYFTSWRSPR